MASITKSPGNAPSGTPTASAGSSSFLSDARALIAAGAFDARTPLPYGPLKDVKQQLNDELARRWTALSASARVAEQLRQRQQLTGALFGAEGRKLLRVNLQNFEIIPFRLSGRLVGTAVRGLSTVGVLSIGINLADAAIKHDGDKAIGILGTTAATGLLMKGVAEVAGTRAVPVVGEVVGSVFAAKDAYDAARSGHAVRATVSGVEAGLYAFSLGAALTGAGAPIALVAGGAAVSTECHRWPP